MTNLASNELTTEALPMELVIEIVYSMCLVIFLRLESNDNQPNLVVS